MGRPKKKRRGRPPGSKTKKKKTVKTKKPAAKKAKGKTVKKKARSTAAASTLKKSKASRVVDLVAGKFIAVKKPDVTQPIPGVDALDNHGEFSRELAASEYRLFNSRIEAAEALENHVAFLVARNSGAGFNEPAAGLEHDVQVDAKAAAFNALADLFDVVPASTVFATSYVIEVNNAAIPSLAWKREAITVKKAIRIVRDEIAEQVKDFKAKWKEFEAKAETVRKEHFRDIKEAEKALSKFLGATAKYA